MTLSLADFREEKDDAFRKAGWSPLTDEQKANFQGLGYYSEDPKLVFQNVVIDPVDAGQIVEIPTSAGDTEKYSRAGIISLTIDGEDYQLYVYKQSFSTNKQSFSTNKQSFSTNNHNWRCPITPEENKLPVAIEAGEKNFNGQ